MLILNDAKFTILMCQHNEYVSHYGARIILQEGYKTKEPGNSISRENGTKVFVMDMCCSGEGDLEILIRHNISLYFTHILVYFSVATDSGVSYF